MIFSFCPIELFRRDNGLTDMEVRVAAVMFSFRNRNTDLVWPSRAAIAARSGYSEGTISNVTSRLEGKGWLEKQKRIGTSVYRMKVPDLPDPDESHSHQSGDNGNPHQVGDDDPHQIGELHCHQIGDTELTNELTKDLITTCGDDADDGTAEKKQIPYRSILTAYHEILPMGQVVAKLTAARRSGIRQRTLEDLPTVDEWRAYFQHVSKSRFLCGRVKPTGDRPPFRVSIDFLISPRNYANILEGKYHQ
jgi:hypothetical protein